MGAGVGESTGGGVYYPGSLGGCLWLTSTRARLLRGSPPHQSFPHLPSGSRFLLSFLQAEGELKGRPGSHWQYLWVPSILPTPLLRKQNFIDPSSNIIWVCGLLPQGPWLILSLWESREHSFRPSREALKLNLGAVDTWVGDAASPCSIFGLACNSPITCYWHFLPPSYSRVSHKLCTIKLKILIISLCVDNVLSLKPFMSFNILQNLG